MAMAHCDKVTLRRDDMPGSVLAGKGYRWFTRDMGGVNYRAVGITRRGKAWEVFAVHSQLSEQLNPGIAGLTYSEAVRTAYHVIRTGRIERAPARKHRVIAPAQLLLAFACVPANHGGNR